MRLAWITGDPVSPSPPPLPQNCRKPLGKLISASWYNPIELSRVGGKPLIAFCRACPQFFQRLSFLYGERTKPFLVSLGESLVPGSRPWALTFTLLVQFISFTDMFSIPGAYRKAWSLTSLPACTARCHRKRSLLGTQGPCQLPDPGSLALTCASSGWSPSPRLFL